MKHSLLVFCLLALSPVLLTGQVSIQATLPAIIEPNSEITFDVKINKGGVANFAKYQIDVPQGVTLAEVNNRTGSFSFESGRGKIIWVAIPNEQEFVLTMKMSTGSVAGSGIIHQKFYYLDGGSKKEVEAEPITINFGDGSGAVASSPAAPSPAAPEQAPPAQEPAQVSEPVAGSGQAEPAKTTEKKETAADIDQLKAQFKTVNEPVASPAAATNGNMVHKIQIGAYGENPGKAKYKGLQEVSILKEGDFYKVLVGNFKDKEEAQKRKNELLEKGFRGFVVSYQNGVRVK